jgi:hypothetical protein
VSLGGKGLKNFAVSAHAIRLLLSLNWHTLAARETFSQ